MSLFARGHAPDLEEIMLKDVIPRRNKIWWHYHGLRTLNLLLLCAVVTDITNGYDGSMLNGLQILPEWRRFFGNPTGSRLGSISNGVRYGQIGALFVAAPLIQRLGRKKPIALGSAILLVGVILQTASQNYAMFITGRLLIGFGNTIQTTACPILISELSHPSQRTAMVGIMNSTGSLGQLMAAWVTFGAASMAGSAWAWRLPSALQAISSLFQLILSFFAPESPRWLVENNRAAEARRILLQYHAEGDSHSPLLEFEMSEIERTIAMEKVQALTSWKEWIRTPANRHRLFIVVTAGFIIQWCGNAVLSNYLHLVLESIGITSKTTQLLINGGMSLNGFFWGNFFSQFVNRIGRRPLFLCGMVGMLTALVVVTILTSVQTYLSHPSLGIATVAMFFIFTAFYKMPAPMVNSYVAEVAPYNLRAKAFVIFGFGDALANLFSGYVNPLGLAAIGWKYWIVWCFALLSNFTIIYFFYPETKNLSLEEVSRVFENVAGEENNGVGGESDKKEESLILAV